MALTTSSPRTRAEAAQRADAGAQPRAAAPGARRGRRRARRRGRRSVHHHPNRRGRRDPGRLVYRYFPDKEAIVEALALQLLERLRGPGGGRRRGGRGRSVSTIPARPCIDALAAGFRAHPGFLTLWYGGLRTERVRAVTRPTRSAIAASVARILRVHWPRTPRAGTATRGADGRLTGDGLLREAFRSDPPRRRGVCSSESKVMIDAYLVGQPRPEPSR